MNTNMRMYPTLTTVIFKTCPTLQQVLEHSSIISNEGKVRIKQISISVERISRVFRWFTEKHSCLTSPFLLFIIFTDTFFKSDNYVGQTKQNENGLSIHTLVHSHVSIYLPEETYSSTPTCRLEYRHMLT